MGMNVNKEIKVVRNQNFTDKFKELRGNFQLENHCWRMYLKPYSKAGVEELEMLKESKYAAERVEIREKNGTYQITSLQPIDNITDYVESLWGMLHRKFDRQCAELAYAEGVSISGFKRVLRWHENELGMPVAEKDRDKTFYILAMSSEFIEAETLPRFRMAG